MNRNYSRLIGSTATADLSALGSNQQRDLDYIQMLISDKNILGYFAEPVINQNNEKIDWYTNATGQIKLFKELTEADQANVKEKLNKLTAKLTNYSDKVKNNFDKLTFNNLCKIPDTNSIVKVGNQIVIINWAYQLRKSRDVGANLENFAGLTNPPDTIELERNDVQVKQGAKQFPSEIEPIPADIVEATTVEPIISAPADTVGAEKDLLPGSSSPQESVTTHQPALKNFQKWIKKYWFWFSIFIILLVLNVILVSDACGIRGIPFLNFCSS
tara:strand:+ start:255 stop:1070 length:816 start_codon:yes stop_codon:yes gene_type:complete